jgi:hypothetical protein
MTWMGSVKVMLISMGVVLVSLAMKVCIPLVKEFIIGSHVAVMWSSIATWLKPPYLYIIINGIIITIVASSRLHQNHHHDDRVDTEPGRYPMKNGSSRQANSDYGFYVESNNKIISSEFGALEQIRPRPLYQQREEEEEEESAPVMKSDHEAVVIDKYETHDHDHEAFFSRSPPPSPPRRINSPEIFYSPPAEKPLASTRFAQRKQFKPIPEGGKSPLKVTSRPKRHETMENTWKAITEGRSMPLSRHMKKCESFHENHGRHGGELELPSSLPLFKKSETFKDRTNQPAPPQQETYTSSPVPSKIRREPSLGQDELNKRVEAFIQKFNEEMRLQRQESLNQYMEMINRGSH